MSTMPSDVQEFPFELPKGFLARLRYPHGKRYVLLYWTYGGDELVWDDGEHWACGQADNWVWLNFMHRMDVTKWLMDRKITFGDLDDGDTKQHRLLIVDNKGYVAPPATARRIVQQQRTEMLE